MNRCASTASSGSGKGAKSMNKEVGKVQNVDIPVSQKTAMNPYFAIFGADPSGSMKRFFCFRNILLLSIVFILFLFSVFYIHAEGDVKTEAQVRELLTCLTKRYERALNGIERLQEKLDGMEEQDVDLLKDTEVWEEVSKKPEDIIKDLMANKTFSSLDGKVITVTTKVKNHDEKDPILIYVDQDANVFLRVAYTWRSDLRIVRNGTKEYDRIREVILENDPSALEKSKFVKKEDIKPLMINFVNEEGRSLPGKFTLIEYAEGCFLSAWFREMNTEGTVLLEDSPNVFTIFFKSDDGVYKDTYNSKDIDLSKDNNLVVGSRKLSDADNDE